MEHAVLVSISGNGAESLLEDAALPVSEAGQRSLRLGYSIEDEVTSDIDILLHEFLGGGEVEALGVIERRPVIGPLENVVRDDHRRDRPIGEAPFTEAGRNVDVLGAAVEAADVRNAVQGRGVLRRPPILGLFYAPALPGPVSQAPVTGLGVDLGTDDVTLAPDDEHRLAVMRGSPD